MKVSMIDTRHNFILMAKYYKLNRLASDIIKDLRNPTSQRQPQMIFYLYSSF